MTTTNKENLNQEKMVAKVMPSNVPMQKTLPQRPLPARPTITQPANTQKEESKAVQVETKEQVAVAENERTKPETKEKVSVKKEKKQKPAKKEKTKNKKAKQSAEESDDKTTKSKTKKSKIILIGSLILVAMVAITLLIVFLSIQIKENAPISMNANASVEVVSFNNQYFLQVEEHEEAYYYVFEITAQNNPTLIFSKTNKIDVSQYFGQKTVFSIRYYLQKVSDKSRSEASLTILYSPKTQLETPVLRLNEENQNLEWNYVNNAGSYSIYYTSGNQVLSYVFVPPVDDEDNIASFVPDFGYGMFDVSIVALPLEEEFFTASEQSNTITISKYEVLDEVFGASYSLINQTIFIDASNLEEENHNFAIHIGNQILYFSPTITHEFYELSVTQYGMELTLGKTVEIVTLGDGEYLLDSSAKVCIPNN